MDEIAQLAGLLKARNIIDAQISKLISRPALMGHVGEYIATRTFDICLGESAAHKAIDGYLRSGPLAGRSVNIKWYARQEGLLDITPEALPDYYLVLTGPLSPINSSRGINRPCSINHVYLFNASELVDRLRARGVAIGVATCVQKALWDTAEIYPSQNNVLLAVSDEARDLLVLFGAERLSAER